MLGATASILQVLDTTTKATLKAMKYLKEVRNAPREVAQLVREAASLVALLEGLRHNVSTETADSSWPSALSFRDTMQGPIEQFKEAMEELTSKLKPQIKSNKLGRMMVWPFDQKDIQAVLERLKRLEILMTLALQKDQM